MKCFLDKTRECNGECVANGGTTEAGIQNCNIVDYFVMARVQLETPPNPYTTYPTGAEPPEVKF